MASGTVKKHTRRKPNTPRSRIRNALRQVFLRSRERYAAIVREGHCCQRCHRRESSAKGRELKIQVHHNPPIDWDGIIDLIADRLLNVPMEVLCEECHDREHEPEKKKEQQP